MKKTLAAVVLLALTATAVLAKPPIFAAECGGGTNADGYNIDTDTEGHVWIAGKKTTPKKMTSTYWIAKSGPVEVQISYESKTLVVSYTGPGGANASCEVIAQ